MQVYTIEKDVRLFVKSTIDTPEPFIIAHGCGGSERTTHWQWNDGRYFSTIEGALEAWEQMLRYAERDDELDEIAEWD